MLLVYDLSKFLQNIHKHIWYWMYYRLLYCKFALQLGANVQMHHVWQITQSNIWAKIRVICTSLCNKMNDSYVI